MVSEIIPSRSAAREVCGTGKMFTEPGKEHRIATKAFVTQRGKFLFCPLAVTFLLTVLLLKSGLLLQYTDWDLAQIRGNSWLSMLSVCVCVFP